MNKLTRILSALMSVAVLASSAGVLPIKAAAADSTDYSINWDYDYGTTPQNALKSLAEQQISITDYTGDVSNVLKEHYNELRWTHVAAAGVDLTYQWQYNSGDVWKNSGASGAATATLAISAKATYNGWQYRCIVTDANGAKVISSTAKLTVK